MSDTDSDFAPGPGGDGRWARSNTGAPDLSLDALRRVCGALAWAGRNAESRNDGRAPPFFLLTRGSAQVFHLPAVEAAGTLGIAHSKLKRRCHKLKIARWPQRKLASLSFLKASLASDQRLSSAQRKASRLQQAGCRACLGSA